MGLRFIFLCGVLAVASCNRPADYAVVGSADVPSVHGDIEIEKIDKGQLLVTIVLDQLPAPGEIEKSLTDYVVWFVVVGEDPSRQTLLEYDADTRMGRASIPTSLREFEIRITAEPTPEPATPNYMVVATQQIREREIAKWQTPQTSRRASKCFSMAFRTPWSSTNSSSPARGRRSFALASRT